MLILGIETSCDETSMSVLEVNKKEKARILSSTVSSQVKIHAKYGGVYPALAAREHAKNIDKVLKLTLQEAGLKSVEEILKKTVKQENDKIPPPATLVWSRGILRVVIWLLGRPFLLLT